MRKAAWEGSPTASMRLSLAPCPSTRPAAGASTKRMKGFEPSTFAMARRRSSQLSYIRAKQAF